MHRNWDVRVTPSRIRRRIASLVALLAIGGILWLLRPRARIDEQDRPAQAISPESKIESAPDVVPHALKASPRVLDDRAPPSPRIRGRPSSAGKATASTNWAITPLYKDEKEAFGPLQPKFWEAYANVWQRREKLDYCAYLWKAPVPSKPHEAPSALRADVELRIEPRPGGLQVVEAVIAEENLSDAWLERCVPAALLGYVPLEGAPDVAFRLMFSVTLYRRPDAYYIERARLYRERHVAEGERGDYDQLPMPP